MSRRAHWTETYQCSCGMRFRSYAAEAKHRHNFPFLCKRTGTKTTLLQEKLVERLLAQEAPKSGAPDQQT